MPKSARPRLPVTDIEDRSNRFPPHINPKGYQWEREGEVVMLEELSVDELRRTLGQSIETLLALEGQGLELPAEFEAWKDDAGEYVWMQGGSMHDVADLSRSDLLQAHCQVMDLIEDLDFKISSLTRILEAWRRGKPVPAV